MEEVFKEMDILLQVHNKTFEYDKHIGDRNESIKAQARRDAYHAYSDWKKLKERVDALIDREQDETLLVVLKDSRLLNDSFVSIAEKLIVAVDHATVGE